MSYLHAEGAIELIYPTQEFTNFKKREFVIKTEGKYPESLKFEFRNDFIKILDNFMEGEMVTVAFVLRGNYFNNRYFVNLEAVGMVGIIDGKIEQEFEKTKKKIKIVDAEIKTTKDSIKDDLPF